MKKKNTHKGILLVMISCMICLHAAAQNNQYIDVWGGVGYSALTHGIEKTKVPGGVGFALGAGYEYNLNQVIFLGGVEFMYLNSKTKLVDYSESRNFLYQHAIPNYPTEYIDPTTGLPILPYKYSFDKYEEKHSIGYLNIPLQVGYRFDRYYFLAGAKVGLNLMGSYRTTATLQTSCEDPMLIDALVNMGNHYLGTKTFDEKGKLSLGLNVAPTVEFGMYLDEWIGRTNRQGRRLGPSYRVSIFADYGVMNLNKASTTNKILSEPVNNPLDVKASGLLSSTLADGKRFGNLFVGVKFAVLFQLPKKTPPPPSKSTFFAHVVDAETKDNVQAEVILAATTGKRQQILKEETDLSTGTVSYDELKHGRYQLTATAEGYANYKKIIRHDSPDTVTVALAPIPVLYVQVTDAKTGDPIQADVTMSAVNQANTQIAKERTNPAGMFKYQIRAGRYHVSAIAEGYLYNEQIVSHTKTDTTYLALEPIQKEVKIVLHNLFFEFGTANILPESEPALADLTSLLTNNPDIRISIVGHTDNVGSAAYNMNLSKERAKAVYDKLVEAGIDPARLEYSGKGDTEPVDTNDTEEGRANNRRVEFQIL